MKDYTELSKFLALVLRHKPETIGISLDKHGWANTIDILNGMKISMQDLEYVVENNNKKRYAFNEDKTKIRAVQGHSHSLNISLNLQEKIPPTILYHGTKEYFLKSILKQGLKRMKRDHVHLSDNLETARNVANRRKGKSVILQIDTREMLKNRQKYYLSENNVWLTEHVSPQYLTIIER